MVLCRNVELVLVINDGEIIECGSHESLLRSNSTYPESTLGLWKMIAYIDFQ